METARYSLFFVLTLTLISCGTGPDTNLHNVSVSVAPEGAGTITPAADSSYENGSTLNLEAHANEGYQFTGWTGDLDSTANPLSLTVDRSYTLTANFEGEAEDQFYLHENGVTILCPDAEPGQKGTINGTEYVAVDRQYLDTYEGDPSKVCTSLVTDMASLFENCTYCTGGYLYNWDVSNVTDMNSMFYGVRTLDADLSNWDVSKVTDMGSMFRGAQYFDGDLSSWDVSKVTDMKHMFSVAEHFNQGLNDWDVSNVTDMSGMFSGGDIMFNNIPTSFNGNISSWEVSSVTDMRAMFYNAASFNQDLSGWCVTNIDEEPTAFSSESALSDEHHPVWGTCSE